MLLKKPELSVPPEESPESPPEPSPAPPPELPFPDESEPSKKPLNL